MASSHHKKVYVTLELFQIIVIRSFIHIIFTHKMKYAFPAVKSVSQSHLFNLDWELIRLKTAASIADYNQVRAEEIARSKSINQ